MGHTSAEERQRSSTETMERDVEGTSAIVTKRNSMIWVTKAY
jgi:hypothetical protein